MLVSNKCQYKLVGENTDIVICCWIFSIDENDVKYTGRFNSYASQRLAIYYAKRTRNRWVVPFKREDVWRIQINLLLSSWRLHDTRCWLTIGCSLVQQATWRLIDLINFILTEKWAFIICMVQRMNCKYYRTEMCSNLLVWSMTYEAISVIGPVGTKGYFQTFHD